MSLVIKQLEERTVANDIECILWNDRMDLIALSNDKGEVVLHRLSWSRCWTLSPPNDGECVKGLAWQPDGKILAIAYSNGTVLLVHIENKNIVHKLLVNGSITCVSWFKKKKVESQNNDPVSTLMEENCKESNSWEKFLTNLPLISSSGSKFSDAPNDPNLNFELIQEHEELNLLVVGTKEGCLQVYIFGQLACADINVNAYLKCSSSVVCAHFSDDLSLLHVTVQDQWGKLNILTFNTEVFKTHSKDLYYIAVKHGYLSNLVTYLTNSILPIKDTWETFLMEMDSKLHNYALKVPENTLSADFLELLTFGICSDEMQSFLLQDLTEKGLKKFGQVVEQCYSNIQKMLLKNVSKSSQGITYHLSELRGMARFKHRYQILGLNEDIITESIAACGAFLVKVDEMHQVIDDFMINYKAFFRWLYMAIANLMDIPLPPDVPKNTQEDNERIANFVLHFDKIQSTKGTSNSTKFVMERLGQYLEDSPLTIPTESNENIWIQFITENDCIRNYPGIVRRYKSYSLIQQVKHLTASIDNIFETPRMLIMQQCKFKNILVSLEFRNEPIQITNVNYEDGSTLIAFLTTVPPAEGIYFIKVAHDSKFCCYIYFKQLDNLSDNFKALDVKFYNSKTMSVLLQNCTSNFGVLCQLPLNPLIEKIEKDRIITGTDEFMLEINGFKFESTVSKRIDGMVCSKIAVSGSRRVSLVLAENKKKVRLFEMEAEEDDDEDVDMNSARESDVSMQEDSSSIMT